MKRILLKMIIPFKNGHVMLSGDEKSMAIRKTEKGYTLYWMNSCFTCSHKTKRIEYYETNTLYLCDITNGTLQG